ncbi:MAG: hypothetical protein IJ326_03410 [Lachnospiraceae bacterium]|nr:hypothetical protein [Lachnospiraceae bacterium]
MKKRHRMNCILMICFSILLAGCGTGNQNEGSDVRSNIDYSFADEEQLQYPTLVRAKDAPIDVVYGQDSQIEDAAYQYYYIYETADCVVGSVAIDFEASSVKDYGMPGDITVIKDGSYYYLNIWTGPGENRNYIYHSEDKSLQQLAYGDIELTDEYLYIQGIVLTVDGGAPLHIYTKDGEHVCKVTDNSTEYKILGNYLYYIENEMVEDESGSYKLHSFVRKTNLNGENDQQVCEVTADTLPVIHEGYVTYEDNGSIYSMELSEP